MGTNDSPLFDGRAMTPVVGVVLSVGITVLLAAVVGSVALGTEIAAPAPAVSHSTATFETGPSVGCTDNVVRLVHEGGQPVPPDELAVVVRLPEIGATARLVALPIAGTQLRSDNVVGDTHNVVYDNCVDGVIANGGSAWTAGTVIKFELNAGGGTVESGDRIVVTVVHEPTGSVLVDTVVRAV